MKRDWDINLELLKQRDQRRLEREEAERVLAPVPGQREALKAARARLEAERKERGPFRRVLRFLRGGR